MTQKYKVSRSGETLGSFTLWEIKEWLRLGKLNWTDDVWTQGMADWTKLEVIKTHVLAAEKPSSEPIEEALFKPRLNIAGKLPLIGLAIFFLGAFVLFIGIIRDPDGSAIRQQVLMQQMTNGILLMILGAIIAKYRAD